MSRFPLSGANEKLQQRGEARRDRAQKNADDGERRPRPPPTAESKSLISSEVPLSFWLPQGEDEDMGPRCEMIISKAAFTARWYARIRFGNKAHLDAPRTLATL